MGLDSLTPARLALSGTADAAMKSDQSSFRILTRF